MMVDATLEPEALATWFRMHRNGSDWDPSDIRSNPRTIWQVLSARTVYMTPDGLVFTVRGASIEIANVQYEYFAPPRRVPLHPVNLHEYLKSHPQALIETETSNQN
jgi:hypothetical protein